MKKTIIVLSLMLSSFANAQVTSNYINKEIVDGFVKLELDALKKDKCYIDMKELSVKQNKDKTLIVIPFESCGGGNNYGQIILGLTATKNGINKKNLPINSANEITITNNGFKILSAEYAKDDPRCCPSIIKEYNF